MSYLSYFFITLLLIVYAAIVSIRSSFYRAYFFQKQINDGKNPWAVLKSNFRLWWIM